MPPRLQPPVGLPTPTTLADDRDWTALVASQLHTIRESAANWRNGLAATIGLITLVLAVREPGDAGGLARGLGVAVGVLLLLALLCAVGGAFAALAAAYGTPGELTRARFRELGGITGVQLQLARRAVRWLRVARIATAASLGLLMVAIALGWFAPREAPALVRVEPLGQPGVCGRLVASSDGAIDVRPATAPAMRLRLAEVRALRPVASCP